MLFIAFLSMTLVLSACDKKGKNDEQKTFETDNTQPESVTVQTEETTDEITDEANIRQEHTNPPYVLICGREYMLDTECIDLSNEEIENVDSFIEALHRLESLREVRLYETDISMEDRFRLVEEFPDVSFGWIVDLVGVEIDSLQTEADISSNLVEDFEAFKKQLLLLGGLEYLDMCDCGLDNQHMEELQNTYPDIKFVWKVTLGLWTIRTDAVAFSTLKDGSITYRLTNEDVQVLKYCKDMVALDIGHNKVTDISFLQYMPNLRILILVDNWDGETPEHYISDLSMIKYVPKLVYLEFFVGDVSDLSFLEYTPEMVDLNISYNPVSDVSYLLNLPKIERLFLEHTGLTEADYKLLCDTYPDAQVVYYGEGSVDQGWRTHERYYAMKDMYINNYVHDLFKEK